MVWIQLVYHGIPMGRSTIRRENAICVLPNGAFAVWIRTKRALVAHSIRHTHSCGTAGIAEDQSQDERMREDVTANYHLFKFVPPRSDAITVQTPVREAVCGAPLVAYFLEATTYIIR